MLLDIKDLIEGNKQFRETFFDGKNSLFDELVTYGQNPKIMIIACSDSRVDPALIFNSTPGQLFVVRNVANLVYPYSIAEECQSIHAALEFAVRVLKVHHIIILGHSQCGGIMSLFETDTGTLPAIAAWMKPVSIICAPISKEDHDQCAKRSILNSLRNLDSFPFIASRVESGRLFLYGWYFDIASGCLSRYEDNSWAPLQ